MSRTSRVIIWIAVVLLMGAYFFPLWSVSLSAPQYPEGMGMLIWISKITGQKPHDLQNINGLNHYIGMKEIHAESIPELRFMKYLVALLVTMGALAATLRRRRLLVAWVIVMVLLAGAGLVDFYKWTYDYGHNLDPNAPIKVPGMTYQPPIFGSKQLLNITATSYPGLGGAMSIVAVLLAMMALLKEFAGLRTKRTRSASPALRQSHAPAVVLLMAILASCSVKPAPISYGSDACNQCMMTITDEKYGAEIVTNKGKVYKYDSIECMVGQLVMNKIDPEDIHSFLTVNFTEPKSLIDARSAAYLHSPSLRSPMGANLTAFATIPQAQAAAELHPGEIIHWNDVSSIVKSTSPHHGSSNH